ncbi:MAG: DUF4974 domain-containing protein [Methylobacter sp.]|nr:DUF4974 domain-containing protein [Methylobacter sp.]
MTDEHLLAGSQRLYKETAGLEPLKTVKAEKLTPWVNGKLVFKRMPLREVAAELEHYHPVQFIFADPKLAQETLGGTFDSADIDPFLHALETILPVRAKRPENSIAANTEKLGRLR